MTKKQEILRNQLNKNLDLLKKSTEVLLYSHAKCKKIGIKKVYSEEELECFEALSSRFARTADILTQKVFRNLTIMLGENLSAFIDVANFVEKIGLAKNADELFDIRELRNEIAHEYSCVSLDRIFQDVLILTDRLMEIIDNTEKYTNKTFSFF
jgi:hypothetical protein